MKNRLKGGLGCIKAYKSATLGAQHHHRGVGKKSVHIPTAIMCRRREQDRD